jgi:hypothetical protein
VTTWIAKPVLVAAPAQAEAKAAPAIVGTRAQPVFRAPVTHDRLSHARGGASAGEEPAAPDRTAVILWDEIKPPPPPPPAQAASGTGSSIVGGVR